jgi:predicted PurR-regulated permease PerM
MVFICCIIAAAVLKIASTVILPFTIAVLLALVMYPLVTFLDKLRIPRAVSILLVVLIIGFGLYIFGFVLFSSGKSLISLYPRYESRLTYVYINIAHLLELSYDEALSFWNNLWGQLEIRNWVFKSVNSFANTSLSIISSAVLVVIFVIFILLEASYFREKLDMAFEGRSERFNKMGNELITQVTRYLAAKFLISLANGIVFAVAFYFIGLDFAIVWGVLQFILNFIPTIGSIVCGVGICLFALVQFWPDPGPIILIVAIVLGVNLILGSFLDPKIIGEHVGISPLLIFVSLAIWGYIWGFAGMILAVPMTVIIKIVCENIPIMEPVSIFLGTRRSIRARKAEQEKADQEKVEQEKIET